MAQALTREIRAGRPAPGERLPTEAVLTEPFGVSRTVRLGVPCPPGGLIDNMARLIAPRLQRELGQALVVDNKPAAGCSIGAAEVACAPPDGYTLLMGSPVSGDAEIGAAMARSGAEVGFLDSAKMGAFMTADAAKWKRVATYARISVE